MGASTGSQDVLSFEKGYVVHARKLRPPNSQLKKSKAQRQNILIIGRKLRLIRL